MWNTLCNQWLNSITRGSSRRKRRTRNAGLIERLEDRRLLSAANKFAAEVGKAAVEKAPVHIFWQFFGPEVSEGNSGETEVELRIIASPAPKKDIKIQGHFAIAGEGNGFADEEDFAATSFTATIKKGEGSTLVSTFILGDTEPEFNEIYSAVIDSAGPNAVIDGGDLTVTILNDDAEVDPELPSVSFVDAGSPQTTEGGLQTFTLELDELSIVDVTVTVALTGTGGNTGATIPADADFGDSLDEITVTIPAGLLTTNVTVFTTDDIFSEQTEGYSLLITGATNANVGDIHSEGGDILDNDTPPNVSVDSETGIFEGNSGTTLVPVNVTLSEELENDVVVNYSIETNLEAEKKQRAKKKKDFVIATGSITITAGQTTAFLNAQIVGDTKREEDETFIVRLVSATGADVSDFANVGVVTIRNDDGASAPTRNGKGKRP